MYLTGSVLKSFASLRKSYVVTSAGISGLMSCTEHRQVGLLQLDEQVTPSCERGCHVFILLLLALLFFGFLALEVLSLHCVTLR